VTCLVTPKEEKKFTLLPTPFTYKVYVNSWDLTGLTNPDTENPLAKLEIGGDLTWPVSVASLSPYIVLDESLSNLAYQTSASSYYIRSIDGTGSITGGLEPGKTYEICIMGLGGTTYTNVNVTLAKQFTVQPRPMTAGYVSSFSTGSDQYGVYHLLPEDAVSNLLQSVEGPAPEDVTIGFSLTRDGNYGIWDITQTEFGSYDVYYRIEAFGYETIERSYYVYCQLDQIHIPPFVFPTGADTFHYAGSKDGDTQIYGLSVTTFGVARAVTKYDITKLNDPNDTETRQYVGTENLPTFHGRGIWNIAAKVYKIVDEEEYEIYSTAWKIDIGGVYPTVRFNVANYQRREHKFPSTSEVLAMLTFNEGRNTLSDYDYMNIKYELLCVETDLYSNDADAMTGSTEPQLIGSKDTWNDVTAYMVYGKKIDVSTEYFYPPSYGMWESQWVHYKLRVVFEYSEGGVYENVTSDELEFYIVYKGTNILGHWVFEDLIKT
jgi:hypothetical protein